MGGGGGEGGQTFGDNNKTARVNGSFNFPGNGGGGGGERQGWGAY